MTGKGLFEKILKYTGYKPITKQLMLCYHHIGNTEHDPWNMYVSKENFNSHCAILNQYFTVLPVNAIFNKSGIHSEKPIIYLSFDDGYEDNFTNAFPVIKKYQLPITVFLCSKIFTDQKLYWWEVIQEIFIAERILPGRLTLNVNEELKTWILSENDSKTALYFALADILKASTIDHQNEIIRALIFGQILTLMKNYIPKSVKSRFVK